ncbi:hypothetical protein [Acidiphilium sp.]|uniref:hypothetical protein n=1 Tax=Acidiphilium sp. TaxID=527 RepID=UPI003D040F72
MRVPLRRRIFLQSCGVGVVMLRSSVAETPMVVAGQVEAPGPSYNILVCGPRGGQTDRWARAVRQGLGHSLSPNRPIGLRSVGGQDGVTGANRLQTLVVPDGQTAAMLPSEAVIAFLTGDPRVHFQPGDWIPVMAGLNAAVLVVRGGLRRLADAAPIRLAAVSPESPDLAALLAFQRLGVATAPVFGLRGASAVARAFAAGEADAVLLAGEEIPADAAPLMAEGGVAIATLGVVDDEGQVVADPLFPDLPTVHAIAIARGASPLPLPLDQAFRAVAAATRIDFMLVLPHLTTPSTVATWRQAAVGAIEFPALQAAAAASAISLTVVGAAAAVAPFDVSADGLLALRQFLFQHFGWRPS